MSLPEPYRSDDDLVVPAKMFSYKDVKDENSIDSKHMEQIVKNIINSNGTSSSPGGSMTSGQKRRKKGGKDQQTKKKSKKRVQPKIEEPPPGPDDMSRKELKEWRGWYETEHHLENYLRMEAEDPKNLMASFYKTLSRMMMCMYDADTFYDRCYLEYYRWEHRVPLKSEENPTDQIHFENGALLMLQIRDILGEWQDWIYIGKSKYGGLGIFTAREFPKKALLGLYVGPEVWRDNRPGTPEPSSEDLTRAGVPDTPCLCSIRNPDGLMLVLCPERVEIGVDPQPIYMGMHWAKGKEEPEVPSDVVANCEIVEDGGVVAHFALAPDQELVCGILE